MGGNQFPLFQNKAVQPTWLETEKRVDISHVSLVPTDCKQPLRQIHRYILLFPFTKKKGLKWKKGNNLFQKTLYTVLWIAGNTRLCRAYFNSSCCLTVVLHGCTTYVAYFAWRLCFASSSVEITASKVNLNQWIFSNRTVKKSHWTEVITKTH